ncbi:hypothetical protein ACU61A_27280 [Pseudonocardia sichuanensis]
MRDIDDLTADYSQPAEHTAVQDAVTRLAAYLTERAAMGGQDVIHGYLDGDGALAVELRASDVQQLLTALTHGDTGPAARRPAQLDDVETADPAPGTGDEQEDRRRMAAAEELLAAWPDGLGEEVLAAVGVLDAFGALAWKLDRLRRKGRDPVEVLREIGTDTVEWAIGSAHNPAAFLASRVQKLSA